MLIFSKSIRRIFELRNLLRKGMVVAAPTETAYGLLADALGAEAVKAVVKLKGRSEQKPIALMAADVPMVRRYFKLAGAEVQLAKQFWPGALTLLLKPKRKFPRAIIGKAGRVGVRIPASPWLRRLVQACGRPLTATSANQAGGKTAYSAATVVRQLKSRGLLYVVDGGSLPHRATSTVALISRGTLTIVRQGAISEARLKRALSYKP